MKTLVFSLAILLLPPFTATADMGTSISTEDICAVRPDLCGKASRQPPKATKAAPQIRQPTRRPASRAPAPNYRISFSSYLNSNHAHSAIGGRGSARQDAFQTPSRPTLYNEGPGESMRDNTAAPTAPPTQPTHSN